MRATASRPLHHFVRDSKLYQEATTAGQPTRKHRASVNLANIVYAMNMKRLVAFVKL